MIFDVSIKVSALGLNFTHWSLENSLPSSAMSTPSEKGNSKPSSILTTSQEASVAPPEKTGKGAAFWLTFLAITVSTFLSALDLTAVGTALPTITEKLNGGDNYVWIGSAYALASTAILPLSGSLADIFGRRPIMLIAIAFFATGSALTGAAQNINMMIAARSKYFFLAPNPIVDKPFISAIQGIGGGAILNLTEIIVSDLVPLAERGLYQGMIGLVWSLASAVGPPIVSHIFST